MISKPKTLTFILLVTYLLIPINKILENLAFNLTFFSIMISVVLNLNKLSKKKLYLIMLGPCIIIFTIGFLLGAKYIKVPGNVMWYKQIIAFISLIFIYKDDWTNSNLLDELLTNKGLRGLQIGTFFLIYIYFNI